MRMSPARDGGDDGDLIAVFERRVLALQEADVFLVEIDVHEPPDLALVVADPVFEPRELSVERLDHGLDVRGRGLHLVFPPRQWPQGRGYANLHHVELTSRSCPG